MSSIVGNKGIVTEGLRCHLDVGVKRSYPGGDTWYDLTTYRNNAILNNGVKLVNDHMRFDNSSVQYAEIPSSPSLEWSDSYVTLCAWVNITSVPEVGFSLPSYHQTIVGKIGSSQSDSSWDLAFGDNWPQQQPAGASDDTYYKPRVNTDGTAAWAHSTSPTYGIDISPIDSFHSYSMVYDGTQIINYQDAKPSSYSGLRVCTGNIDVNSATSVKIARTANSTSVNSHINGFIDIVMIYKKALTIQEIQQNYNALKQRFQ